MTTTIKPRNKKSAHLSAAPSDILPLPQPNERPTQYADRVGEWYVASKSAEHRKSHGLYLTPVPTADYMAEQIQASGKKLRILDPAAGAGVLCCAAVEVVASRRPATAVVELIVYEIDEGLAKPLRAVLNYLAEWCHAHSNLRLEAHIEMTDFVMANAKPLQLHGGLLNNCNKLEFDVIISNPPYFKICKADPRSIAAPSVVHGQPNIYALFMAVSAAILKKNGDFVFITPRSFASGPYFRQFRTIFFSMIRPVKVHVFDSRRDAFSRDDVLQENIIFTGIRYDNWSHVEHQEAFYISSSNGTLDILSPNKRTVFMRNVLNLESIGKVLRLPLSNNDDKILELFNSWQNTLDTFGLNISTGPVVPFRATELIEEIGSVPCTHAPLLWMNHVRAMQVTWPLDRHKPEYIKLKGSQAILVRNTNYVLIRRFSAKEEARRLTAAPYLAPNFEGNEIGLENHLNYIHRPSGVLTEDEAWGFAALFNSRLFDDYFRCSNGNTQVSATELRAMPLPPHDIILALGREIKYLMHPMDRLESLIMGLIAHPAQ